MTKEITLRLTQEELDALKLLIRRVLDINRAEPDRFEHTNVQVSIAKDIAKGIEILD